MPDEQNHFLGWYEAMGILFVWHFPILQVVMTMKHNQAAMKKWKMHVYGLIAIVLVQSIVFFLLNILLKEFAGHGHIYMMVMLSVVAICIAVDLYYLFTRVILLRLLLTRQPVKCRLEDILLIDYKEDQRTRYAPFPIVRSIKDSRLYLAYDKYSLLGFNAKFNYSDKEKITCTIYREDGTSVKLGDTVEMYVMKILDIPVSVDESRNTVKLKNKKIRFRHVNNTTGINMFKQMIYFQGAVSVDTDSW